ncbi:MAG: MFS transporter [Acidimicrobiia bacterium]|nr:MFS transporter [Acidimicrobiia bacterium]
MSRERGAPEGAPLLGEFPGTEEVPGVAWPVLWRERARRRVAGSDRYRWWVLCSVLTGVFATGFTITVLAVAIPEIADDLGASETTLTWVVTGPFLAHALGMPLMGRLGDRSGHRRVYLIGLGLFAIFTGLTAFAWSAGALIVLRIIGGFEGAATGPASMALIMHAFGPADRVRAMGWWALVGAGAPVIGIVVGGPLVEAVGWRVLFLAQLPLVAIAWLISSIVLHETPRRDDVSIDVRGALLLAATVIPPLLALNVGAAQGWTSPLALTLFALGPICAWGFVHVEATAADPILPLEFFARRNFTAPLVALSATQFAYMGGFIITPLLMEGVFGYSLSLTGLVMLSRPLSYSLSAPPAGYVAVRVGERTAALTGTLCIGVSMVVFAAGAAAGSVWLVVLGLVASGLGLGISSPSLISSVANSVDLSRQGIAGAAQQMVGQLGLVAGIQVLATVQGGGDEPSSFVRAYLVGAAVAAVAVAAAGFVRSADRSPAAVP